MSFTHFSLSEEDILRLMLEFCSNRKLHIAQLSIERETGIINGDYSDDMLFLRQLILDGQWDDVLDFIQPLDALPSFDLKQFTFLILQQKFIELLCVRSESAAHSNNAGCANRDSVPAVDDVVQLMEKLEKFAPSKESYNNLCLLLTTPRLTDHLLFKNWNPSASRYQCFLDIFPLVKNIMQNDKRKSSSISINDRLMQLIIKGILYESCVKFCKVRSSQNPNQTDNLKFSSLLDGSIGFSDSDLSLLSWLQTLPFETFTIPFEQRSLTVDVERFDKPTLETSWSEHMLVTPIKPKTFPHSAMPFTRPRGAADMMTRSLMSTLDPTLTNNINLCDQKATHLGSFHLTGLRTDSTAMNVSVDRLFENDPYVSLSNETKFNVNSSQNECTVSVLSNGVSHEISKDPNTEFQMQKQKLYDAIKDREDFVKKINVETCTSDSIGKLKSSLDMNGQSNNSTKDSFNDAIITNNSLGSSFGQNGVSTNTATAIANQESFSHYNNGSITTTSNGNGGGGGGTNGHAIKESDEDEQREKFIAITNLEDVQAIRCADFHPNGKLYAVGSNSKTLRLCAYPNDNEIRKNHKTCEPTVLYKRTKHHKGSIYCLAWSPAGDLLATGSNDKSVKLMRFNSSTLSLEEEEAELTMHDGTVRDLCFLEDSLNKSSLLISGGAGDCKIYVTDCMTGSPFQAFSGHSGNVLSLYNWGGAMFVSGSQDKTVRFWDLRTRGCVNMIQPITSTTSKQGSPVASICVDPSGRLLVSGHEDSTCVLYDIRGAKIIQTFRPHTSDIRSIRFSPSAFYLLTCAYDNKLVLTDLQGDLCMPLPSVAVAEHQDKVISCRWHPKEFSFLSTSADKTCSLWALPPV